MKAIHKVNLTKIEGFGNFPCPVCGTIISPDDVDEESYKILEVRYELGFLNEILLQCNKCNNTINLVGFDGLKEEIEKELQRLNQKERLKTDSSVT